MPRWQDRGEVADSDEEEIFSGGNESQALNEQPRKRVKLSVDEGNHDRISALHEHSTRTNHSELDVVEDDWLLPKVTTTYGKQASASTPHPAQFQPCEAADNSSPPRKEDGCERSTQTKSSGSCKGIQPSPELISGQLPIDANRSPKLQVVIPVISSAASLQADDSDSSGLSSPLSERDLSPPPQWLMRELNQYRNQAHSMRDDNRSTTQETSISFLPTAQVHIEELYRTRRNLRARQEKQLHPYLYDKTVYQQQFRARGLKPVHYSMADRSTREANDESFAFEDSQSQNDSIARPSSPVPDSSVSREDLSGTEHDMPRPSFNQSDDGLPGIDAIVHSRRIENTRGHKRRKVSRHKSSDQSSQLPGVEEDVFAVPLSPPISSSNSVEHIYSPSRAVGFQMPKGMTPVATCLPTPQISSEIRPVNNNNNDRSDASSQELPATVRRRLQSRQQIFESSSESSDSDPEMHANHRHMQKVQKRIRGVLPASWLKIDMQARKRPVSKSPPPCPPSGSMAPRNALSKGVAQRVRPRMSGTPSATSILSLSDTDEGSDQSSLPSVFAQPQGSLHISNGNLTIERPDFGDEDDMEYDQIDQMLGARSNQRRIKQSTRQPRVTDAFKAARSRNSNYEDDRTTPTVASNSNPKSSKRQSTKAPRRSRTKAPRLSIADAPNTSLDSSSEIPQFVRLAMRHTRKQPDRGRHSPSHKLIRLATEEDTNDAYDVLAAWQRGAISQRIVQSRPCQDQRKGPINHVQTPKNANNRAPFNNFDENEQNVLPSPLRKEYLKSRDQKSRQVAVRRARPRQTRDQPIVLSSRGATEDAREQSDMQTRQQPIHRMKPVSHPPRAHYRDAQLETLENTFHTEHRAANFERRINCLTEGLAQPSIRTRNTALQMERFLQDKSIPLNPQINQTDSTIEPDCNPTHQNSEERLNVVRKRRRKPLARRIDIETREYRQPSEPLPDNVVGIEDAVAKSTHSTLPLLSGLGPFGTRYATDFDVQPLLLGTFFRESTFIGSGDFSTSLNFAGRQLDKPTGHIRVHVEGAVFEWGSWTEEVATGLARIPNAIKTALSECGALIEGESSEQLRIVNANIVHMLRSVVRYLSRCISFLDEVDRRSCVQQMQDFLEAALEVIEDDENANSTRSIKSAGLQYLLVISYQARGLADHSTVTEELKTAAHHSVQMMSRRLAQHIFPQDIIELRSCYEANRHVSRRERGLDEQDLALSSLVLLNHILRPRSRHESNLWEPIFSSLNIDTSSISSVGSFDTTWYNIFSILPSLEIDTGGNAHPGSRFIYTEEDWSMPKRLVDRLFDLYPATSLQHSSSMNTYIKATLTRCHRLITRWGWWKCESVLGSVFDFFARRGLAQLHQEVATGSPSFLTESDLSLCLEVQIEDSAFHIFLKLLVAGLQGMRKRAIYNNKKIGGIAWRFIPNHGRTYPKDAEVERTDIDALRNHHDLLCTLYISMPAGHRPRVDLIRNLVDHNTSHREACRLNIRAWTNLTTFQASTIEPADALKPLTTWFRETMQITVAQYRMAKTEAERDFAIAKEQGSISITQEIMNATIISNQRQLAATIVEALAGLKRALKAASSISGALCLVRDTSFWSLFLPFDPSERRMLSNLEEALEITRTALDAHCRLHGIRESQHTSDDSQEYGDSSALQELAATQAPEMEAQSTTNIVEILHEPVSQLVSNLVGADIAVNDALLTKTIDVWVQLARASVRSGETTWGSYIENYGSDAWSQLRDTSQKRKLTPYFLARVISSADNNISYLETNIMSAWLTSSVEREALLKYQHLFTSALLNNPRHGALVDNLPFIRDPQSGHYKITLHDFRSRRLAVISTVLSNMRDNFNRILHESPYKVQETKKTYGDLLRHVMQAMKANYQELQASSDVQTANANVQGSYVEFVQHIVGFLQQYTADICRIDPFFTDSSAFPLPADDPTYVVGRLRSYVPKLADVKIQKQLVVFLHTVNERAAVDGQQPYFVEQLCTALGSVAHRNQEATSILRDVLLGSIFPSYVEVALSLPCGWILALPVLQACDKIFHKLLYNVDFRDVSEVSTVKECIKSVIRSMQLALEWTVLNPDWKDSAQALRILALIFNVCRSMLTICEYIQCMTGQGGDAIRSLRALCSFAGELKTVLDDPVDSMLAQFPDAEAGESCQWLQARDYALNHVRSTIKMDWYAAASGQYFLRRGNLSKEVTADIGTISEERERLLKSVKSFVSSFDTVMSGRRKGRSWQTRSGLSVEAMPI